MSNATLTELTLIEGSSDKFYRVFLLPTPNGGMAVTCQYGRNGTYGSFIPRKLYPTAQAAQTAADKTIAGKTMKGYSVVKAGEFSAPADAGDIQLDTAANLMPAGTAQAGIPQLRQHSASVTALNDDQTPVDPAILPRVLAAFSAAGWPESIPSAPGAAAASPRPMLAATVDHADLNALLDSDSWVMQPKLDGDRVIIEVLDGVVTAYNRQGQPKVTNVPLAALAVFRGLTSGRWLIDGEIVGKTLYLFDMPAGPHHREDAAWAVRDAALTATMSVLGGATGVDVVRHASGPDAKRAMLAAAEKGRKEGVIFRDITAAYTPGRSAALLKHKFTKTVDAVITAVRIGGKDNAALGVYDGSGGLVRIGQVSTIGKAAAVSDVVEVRYLYTTNPDSPVLFQPTILRTRHDKAASECHLAQLDGMHTDRAVN